MHVIFNMFAAKSYEMFHNERGSIFYNHVHVSYSGIDELHLLQFLHAFFEKNVLIIFVAGHLNPIRVYKNIISTLYRAQNCFKKFERI